MGRGYVKLYREAMDHAVFQDEWLWKLFSWCVLKANFRDTTVRGQLVPRGSFLCGRIAAGEELHAAPSRVYRGFERLKAMGCIEVKPNTNWTTITVCNYETYQAFDDEDRTTSERRNGQPANTGEETNNPINQPANPPSPPSALVDPPGSAGEPEAAGRLADGFVDSWGSVKRRLAELGASRWREAISEARECGCTPAIAQQILDYGQSNGYQVGAMICRLSKAHPGMPISAGWPAMPKAAAAEQQKTSRAAERQRRELNESLATQIIKNGRRSQKPDEAIAAELKSAGLEWPK